MTLDRSIRVAVAGGSGLVGRHVVARLRQRGAQPIVLARSHGVDITSGAGLAAAMAGATVVIDVSNVTTARRRRAEAFFSAATTRLLAAGREAGVRHHVALSIVGCDRVPWGYYQGKVRQEELVLADGVPGSVLRATQFHEFAAQMLQRATGPLALIPRMSIQPVAAREVAAALVELAFGDPTHRISELAGPRDEELVDCARRLAAASDRRPRVVGIRPPGAAGRAMAGGSLRSDDPDAQRGSVDFETWLAGDDSLPFRTARGGAG